jgi:large subunit ribosomal protein L10
MEKLLPLLEGSTVVLGLRYQGLTVKQMQPLRKALPTEGAKLLVCKNSLLKRAAEEIPGWEELKGAAKGDNAWLFIQEEQVASSVKAYLAYQSKLRDALPKDKREDFKLLDVSGGAMSGKALTSADVKRLEKLPTKLELITKVAQLMNQLPTKLAVAVKQVPTKLAYGIKALADADDNKDAVVGDVCKPAPATE